MSKEPEKTINSYRKFQSTTMSSQKLTNHQQEVTNNNVYQLQPTDLPNNAKVTNHTISHRNVVEIVHNDLDKPRKKCDVNDGNCDADVKTYGFAHFNCLSTEPGQQRTHNFCNYHFKNASYCPIHPTFNRIL
ncbi:uncharacterized protein [Dysidea avara]|uniref:uncharacterized protein n=1 Tax=Dysidea avara TaxID=196820 RepID=UPI0033215DE1